ncbi:hypothetical protein [Hymenobacter cellulosivorans]|uniref:Uncharacterized protein n=1 Tax=Hymenobacter cellulosivorans TaxID=2932249 RepID=A0ABY4F1X6_9BACT|nr:hypothetical protein [Hymenobacter cellulosivorans]UOQ50679.1 hypothetical protein MUN80_13005 [Hymenobacter cellulosivorans]
MNVDLTATYKDARNLLNTWKSRYSAKEYPQKVIANIFYRKYTIDKIFPQIINNQHSDWHTAYRANMNKYADTAQREIIPVLESNLSSNKKVTTMKYSDFEPYIDSASKGNIESVKSLEYSYFLNRIFDELIIIWISMVNSGISKTNAVAQLTRAVLAPGTSINSYADIESVFDQLGAEQYLQSLMMKEMTNQL